MSDRLYKVIIRDFRSLSGFCSNLHQNCPDFKTIFKEVISDYLNWFEDAYFLFQVFIYDASIKRANANDKKIYCIDHSLVKSVTPGILVNSGHMLENLIFIALRGITEKIYYFRTSKGKEIDFIVILPDHSKVLIQVCESLRIPTTYERETNSLNEAMEELGLKSGIIVTMTEQNKLAVAHGAIDIMPAWQFLLELEKFRL